MTLVNCGASGCFVDAALVAHLGWQMTWLGILRMVYNVDGTPNNNGLIQLMISFTLWIGDKDEHCTFYVIQCGNEDAILGLPWLCKAPLLIGPLAQLSSLMPSQVNHWRPQRPSVISSGIMDETMTKPLLSYRRNVTTQKDTRNLFNECQFPLLLLLKRRKSWLFFPWNFLILQMCSKSPKFLFSHTDCLTISLNLTTPLSCVEWRTIHSTWRKWKLWRRSLMKISRKGRSFPLNSHKHPSSSLFHRRIERSALTRIITM